MSAITFDGMRDLLASRARVNPLRIRGKVWRLHARFVRCVSGDRKQKPDNQYGKRGSHASGLEVSRRGSLDA